MKILVTGANGFIGGYLVAHLLQQGHQVVCCVRDVITVQKRFPLAKVLYGDFNKDISIEDWLPRIQSMDAVINCVGILQAKTGQNIENIHYQTPLALFQACEQKQIKRVIQISALGVADGPAIDYVLTKNKLDQALLAMNLSSCVLRPSLVYASGAYGGTALLRALASLPFAIPLLGSGHSRFQPVAMFDLVKVITHCLHANNQGIVNVVSPVPVSIKMILIHFRLWLGFKSVKAISIPTAIIKPLIKLGDWFGIGPLNSVSYQMTLHENMADITPLQEQLDFKMTPFPKGLNYFPSQTQDRWHARLYFIRPLLKISLVLLWLLSGALPLLGLTNQAEMLLKTAGFSSNIAPIMTTTSCLWDIMLGLALMFSFKNKLIGMLQLLTILSYTLIASVLIPDLWLDPLAPLLKNLPILTSVLVWLAIEDMR